jgi:hypothetical protein
MVPLELYIRYKMLQVPLDENRTLGPLSLNLYLNPREDSSTSGVIEEGKLIVQEINQQLRSKFREVTGLPAPPNSEPMLVPADKLSGWYPALRNRPIRIAGNNLAFTARGSPEEIELALAAAASVGHLEKLGSAGPEERVTQLFNRYIGLDCAGFAGNFFVACGYSWGGGPQKDTPPHSYASHGREIGLDEAIPPGAVLLFPRFAEPFSSRELSCEHIAVVSIGGPPKGMLLVVESCSTRNLAIGAYRRTGEGGIAKTRWTRGEPEEHIVHELIHPSNHKVYVVIRALLG